MRLGLMICAALFMGMVPLARPVPEKVTTVYVLRHAEKAATPGEADPELAAAGKERAEFLARSLRSAGVTACFATQYRRTRDTLAPLARAAGIEVQIEQAGKEKALAARILAEMKGQCVAIAGHSNTVPALLEALGLADPPELGEKDYDDLFVVRIDAAGTARLIHLHYGAANPD